MFLHTFWTCYNLLILRCESFKISYLMWYTTPFHSSQYCSFSMTNSIPCLYYLIIFLIDPFTLSALSLLLGSIQTIYFICDFPFFSQYWCSFVVCLSCWLFDDSLMRFAYIIIIVFFCFLFTLIMCLNLFVASLDLFLCRL